MIGCWWGNSFHLPNNNFLNRYSSSAGSQPGGWQGPAENCFSICPGVRNRCFPSAGFWPNSYHAGPGSACSPVSDVLVHSFVGGGEQLRSPDHVHDVNANAGSATSGCHTGRCQKSRLQGQGWMPGSCIFDDAVCSCRSGLHHFWRRFGTARHWSAGADGAPAAADSVFLYLQLMADSAFSASYTSLLDACLRFSIPTVDWKSAGADVDLILSCQMSWNEMSPFYLWPSCDYHSCRPSAYCSSSPPELAGCYSDPRPSPHAAAYADILVSWCWCSVLCPFLLLWTWRQHLTIALGMIWFSPSQSLPSAPEDSQLYYLWPCASYTGPQFSWPSRECCSRLHKLNSLSVANRWPERISIENAGPQ